MPFDIFVMYRFTVLVLLLVVRSDSTPTYFGHLDPDINCVFHAIGRYYYFIFILFSFSVVFLLGGVEVGCLLCLFVLIDVYE